MLILISKLNQKQNPALRTAPTLPQRGGSTSPARCFFYFSLMRNAHSIPLSRGYRGGQRPRRTLKGGQGGTIVGSPCFFRFLSSEKGRIYKKAISILVQTHLETGSLLSTFLKNLLFSKIQKETDSLPSSSLKNQKSSFLKSLTRNVSSFSLPPSQHYTLPRNAPSSPAPSATHPSSKP